MKGKIELSPQEVAAVIEDHVRGSLGIETDFTEIKASVNYPYSGWIVEVKDKAEANEERRLLAKGIERVNAGTPFETLAPDRKPSLKSIETVTDVSLIPAAVSETGV